MVVVVGVYYNKYRAGVSRRGHKLSRTLRRRTALSSQLKLYLSISHLGMILIFSWPAPSLSAVASALQSFPVPSSCRYQSELSWSCWWTAGKPWSTPRSGMISGLRRRILQVLPGALTSLPWRSSSTPVLCWHTEKHENILIRKQNIEKYCNQIVRRQDKALISFTSRWLFLVVMKSHFDILEKQKCDSAVSSQQSVYGLQSGLTGRNSSIWETTSDSVLVFFIWLVIFFTWLSSLFMSPFKTSMEFLKIIIINQSIDQ